VCSRAPSSQSLGLVALADVAALLGGLGIGPEMAIAGGKLQSMGEAHLFSPSRA
jgi:hypothetical protein